MTVRARALGAVIATGAMTLGLGAPVVADDGGAAGSAPTSVSLLEVAAQIGADELWGDDVTGAGVTVAVVDTGVTPVAGLHEPDKIVAVVDLSTEAHVEEATYLDTYGHGTHMAGIIAGRDDASGFRGIAPDAEIVSVKVADNTGAADITQVIAGVDWVVDHADELGIDVLNLSYSSGSPLGYEIDPLSYAVERAWRAGIVVVVAAGNDGRQARELASPADNPYVIAVGASEFVDDDDHDDGYFTVPSWATSGDGVRNPDLVAPGASIESLRVPFSRVDTEHPEGYVDEMLFRGSGSSQASAVVSGAVALLLQDRPELTPDQVKALVTGNTAEVSPGVSKFSGSGALQIDDAAAASTPSAVQTHPAADGTGSIEAARGDWHVVVDGEPVVGEVTVLGDPWEGARWTGARWTEATWDGARWTDGSWMGARWTGARWTGARWTGARWTGAEWSGEGWEGARWTGARWTGARWTDASWTGARWTGARWTGDSWTGARWTDETWSGARWTGARWSGARWT